jgi:hypothetical protein
MATINFPTSPANGATYDYQGIRYTWVETGGTGFWKVVTPGTFGAATATEINTGTDTGKYVTPQALADSKQVTELASGVTELDHSGTKKLSTSPTGVSVHGKIYADNHVDGITASAAEINILDGFTGDTADLEYAKSLKDTGVTTTEFDKLDGLTASTSELNKMDGVTASTTELNRTDGVTSNIQTQLNAKAALNGSTGNYFSIASASTSTTRAIRRTDYATSTLGGTAKMRVSGGNLYITTNGNNA